MRRTAPEERPLHIGSWELLFAGIVAPASDRRYSIAQNQAGACLAELEAFSLLVGCRGDFFVPVQKNLKRERQGGKEMGILVREQEILFRPSGDRAPAAIGNGELGPCTLRRLFIWANRSMQTEGRLDPSL